MSLMINELRTARDLGLSAQWIIAQPIPEEEVIREMKKRADRIVTGIVMAFSKVDLGSSTYRITLLRYKTDEDLWRFRPSMYGLPATFHAAIIERVSRLLTVDGMEGRIVTMDPVGYVSWLNGRADSESLRGAWAAQQSVEH